MATKHLSVSQGQQMVQGALDLVSAKNYAQEADLGDLAEKDEVAEADLDSTLADKINNKADAGTTISDYGITDAYTKTEVDNAISEANASVFKPGGTLAANEIVASLLVEGNLGKVYNISEDFTTDSNFREGAGKDLPAGTNIVIVDVDTTGSSPSYKFDLEAGAYGVATPDGNGLMSSSDKSKLNGVEDNANNYSHPTYSATTGAETANQTPGFGESVNVSQIVSDASGHITSQTNRTITIPNTPAAPSDEGVGGTNGLMSASDKEKLDDIEVASAADITAAIAALTLS